MAEKFRVEGELATGKFNAQAEEMRARAEGAATANGRLTASFGAVSAAVAGVAGIVGGAVAIWHKANEAIKVQTDAEVKLAAAIRGTGQAINATRIKEYAAELQALTTFGDEATIEAGAMLATFNLTEQQIIDLLPRVQNLSAMYGGSLVDSAKLVGRAMTQGASALSRVGVVLDEHQKKSFKAADATGKVAQLMEILDSNTGDAAESLARATGGATQMSNAIGDVFESLGELTQSTTNQWFRDLASSIGEVNSALRNYFGLAGSAEAETRDLALQNRVLEPIGQQIAKTRDLVAGLEAAIDAGSGEGFVAANLRGFQGMSPEAALGGLQMRLDELEEKFDGELTRLKSERDARQPGGAGTTRPRTPSGGGHDLTKEEQRKAEREGLAAIAAWERKYQEVDRNIAEARRAREDEEKAAADAERDAKLAAIAAWERKYQEVERNISAARKERAQEEQHAEREMLRRAEHASRIAIALKRKEEEHKRRIAEEQARAEHEFKMRMLMDFLNFARSAFQQSFTLALDILDAGIRGQKDAIAGLVINFVKGIGLQIMSLGVQYGIQGAAALIASGGQDPKAYGMLAIGAAAVGVGGAMAATGTVVGASLANVTSARGGGSGGAGGSRGLSSGSSQGISTGREAGPARGEGNITVVYNGGSHYGDTAGARVRRIRQDQRRATRDLHVPGG